MDLHQLTLDASVGHGLISFDRARAAGWSTSSWYRAHHAGTLVRAAPGVARIAGTSPSTESRILAPIIALGPGAVASHRSGAFLWGLDIVGDDPVDIIVSNRAKSLKLPGLIVHRPRDLGDLRPTMRSGIPCANPLRILIDLGAVAPERVDDAVAHFAIGATVSPDAAWAALARHSRPGRHGSSALRRALTEWKLGSRPPDSVLEVEMSRLLDRHQLPRAEFHARIAGFEVDFLIEGTRLVIECDGWACHGARREQQERDTKRDATLGQQGYVVRRFTWQQITRRPAWVAGVIRDHIVWAS